MALILPYHSRPECLEYQRRYRNERRRKLRDQFFADKACLKCGSGIFLEIHHRKPHEKETHRDLWFWKEERRKVELAKCDTLCKDCHDREQEYTLALLIGWVGQRVT